MTIVIPNDSGELRKAADVMAADHLFELKRKALTGEDDGNHKVTLWDVIGECIKIWISKNSSKWRSYLYDIGQVKSSRADSEFGKSKESIKYHGHRGSIRYTIDIPEPVYLMIRCIYNDEELPMNRDFFREFGKRFPQFKIAKKQ